MKSKRRYEGVLTCIPEPNLWREAVGVARNAVVPGGLLYIRDFSLSPTHYSKRYADGLGGGYGEGTFAVPDRGAPLFFAKHHTEDDIRDLCIGYDVLALARGEGTSMNGNVCNMFELVARKPFE